MNIKTFGIHIFIIIIYHFIYYIIVSFWSCFEYQLITNKIVQRIEKKDY